MKHRILCPNVFRVGFLGLVCAAAATLHAGPDAIEMVNGDRYVGTVVSVTRTNVEFQSEIQGRTFLPREKVAVIQFGTAAELKPAPARPAAQGNAVNQALQQLRTQGAGSNLMQQVQQQMLAGAGPEATQRFNEMVQGLTSGTLTLDNIREQARDSVKQLREVKAELGEDGEVIEGYLQILESFLTKTEAPTPAPSTPPAKTNASTIKPAPR